MAMVVEVSHLKGKKTWTGLLHRYWVFLIRVFLALHVVCARELRLGSCFLHNVGLIENLYVVLVWSSIESAVPNKNIIPLSCYQLFCTFNQLKVMCIEVTTFHVICFDGRILNFSLFTCAFWDGFPFFSIHVICLL